MSTKRFKPLLVTGRALPAFIVAIGAHVLWVAGGLMGMLAPATVDAVVVLEIAAVLFGLGASVFELS